MAHQIQPGHGSLAVSAMSDIPNHCIKCGHEAPFVGPIYICKVAFEVPNPSEDSDEALMYRCESCGYAVYLPTLDGKKVEA